MVYSCWFPETEVQFDIFDNGFNTFFCLMPWSSRTSIGVRDVASLHALDTQDLGDLGAVGGFDMLQIVAWNEIMKSTQRCFERIENGGNMADNGGCPMMSILYYCIDSTKMPQDYMLPIRMTDPYESSAGLNTRPHGTHDDLVHERKLAYFERQPIWQVFHYNTSTVYTITIYFIIDHDCIPWTWSQFSLADVFLKCTLATSRV